MDEVIAYFGSMHKAAGAAGVSSFTIWRAKYGDISVKTADAIERASNGKFSVTALLGQEQKAEQKDDSMIEFDY